MKRSKRIFVLLGVLAVVCLAAFGAAKYQQRQEQIQNSEEVILSLSAEDVQCLSWSYDETNLSFTRDENSLWCWDEDSAFPVSEDKLNELLDLFSSFTASFIIEEVEDYSQYGLDEPICTIEIKTAEKSYTLELGDFSKLDAQRYVSLGDGNAYLVSTDPMDTYEITIENIIEHDAVLSYDAITSVCFAGNHEWSFDYVEDSTDSVCAEDVYFNGSLPLDTAWVDNYLDKMGSLGLTTYVSYNATEQELDTYGLSDPELTILVNYTMAGETEEDEAVPGSYTLHISRSAELRAEDEAEETEVESEEETEVTEEDTSYVAYARVGDSQIIYEISSSTYESLMEAGYNDLRHREVFPAEFDLITAIDVELEGNTYSLTTKVENESEEESEEDDEDAEETLVWVYGEEEISITSVSYDLTALSASEFTEEAPTGQQELKLTLHLDHDYFPQVEIVLYRYDGTNCLAVVDGESFALVSRSDVVDLVESIHAIVLN